MIQRTARTASIPRQEAIELLVQFGKAYGAAVDGFTDEDDPTELQRAPFREVTAQLLEHIMGNVPAQDDIDSVWPRDEHSDLESIAISQAANPPPVCQLEGARALLIEFGCSYWYASHARRYDPKGYLMTSTQVLLYLLTGKPPKLVHIEQIAPIEAVLVDA